MGMAPLGLPTSPMPLNNLQWELPGLSLLARRAGFYMLCPEVSFVLSPVNWTTVCMDFRVMEESLELGLPGFGGSCSPRA